MRNQLVKLLPHLRRFAFALTGDTTKADDLLQGTVEQLLQHGSPDDVELRNRAFRVCKNLWVDSVRKQKIRMVSDSEITQGSSTEAQSEQLAFVQINLREVNEAMNLLPNEQRVSLVMATVGGMSYAEISDVMDIPINTVISNISQARAALVRFFDADLHEASNDIREAQYELH